MASYASLALRLALVAAAVAAVYGWQGVIAALVVGCLGALALARPIVEVASDARHTLRRAALGDLQGRFYAFHGRPLQVLEDDDHRRWVRVNDVRAIVGFTTTDGALALSYPSGFRRIGEAGYLSDEALLVHLAREPAPAALKLRHWAEREVTHPARQVRARLGIRIAPPEAPLDSDLPRRPTP
jgi:hypothetical protein